jgi:hypothetical protein
VSPLDNIFEDLKTLPPARLEVAADFVHRPKRISEEERQAIFTRTAGALSAEEADELERVIEEGCEKAGSATGPDPRFSANCHPSAAGSEHQ